MDPATFLIIATSAWIGSEAVHNTGKTTRDIGGDIAAWRRGESPPSHERWMKDHERRMAKLNNKQQGNRKNTNAALLNAMRIAENATARSARRSDQKTRAHREYHERYGDELARDQAQRRINRRRRAQEIAGLFWAAWDEQVERGKERVARKRNERIGHIVDDPPGNTDTPNPGQPGPTGGEGQHPTVDPTVIELLLDMLDHDRAENDQQWYTPRPPGWSTDYDPHRTRPDPPPEPEHTNTTDEPAPDLVRAHAERIREEVPALAAPDPNNRIPDLAINTTDDDVIDAEIVDDAPSEDASTELATVHPINRQKGTVMAIEGGHTAVANKIKEFYDHMESMIGILETSYDELETEGWNGQPMDLLATSITNSRNAANNMAAAADLIKTGGDNVADTYTANNFVGSKESVMQG